MKKLAALSVVVALLVAAAPSQAWANGFRHHGFEHHQGFGHHHVAHHRGFRTWVFIGVGPAVVFPYYYYYPLAYYVYTPPPVVVHEPPVYIQQQPAQTAPAPQESLWYYCPSAKAYYPLVQTCSEAWVRVAPRSE